MATISGCVIKPKEHIHLLHNVFLVVSHAFLAKTLDTTNRPAPLEIFYRVESNIVWWISFYISDGKITVLTLKQWQEGGTGLQPSQNYSDKIITWEAIIHMQVGPDNWYLNYASQ